MAKDDKKTPFKMKLLCETTDKKVKIYEGLLGNVSVGRVSAANQTAAKKKLLTLARKHLK